MLPMRRSFRNAIILSFRTFSSSHSVCKPKTSKASSTRQATKAKTTRKSHAESGQLWSPDEVAQLLKLRETRAAWADIEPHFPGRNLTSIRKKYLRIAPRGEQGRLLHSSRFTDAERKLLIQLHEDGVSWPEIQRQHFPDRRVKSLIICYHMTRVKGQDDVWAIRPWSETDAEQLLVNREEKKLDFTELSKVHGRSQASVRNKYLSLIKKRASTSGDDGIGYVGVKSKRYWSEGEEESLIEMIKSGKQLPEIRKAFPKWDTSGLEHKVYLIRAKEGLVDAKVSPVDEKTVAMVLKLRAEGMNMREITELMPEFQLGELRYAYRRAVKSNRKAAGLPPAAKKLSRVDEQSLAKLIEFKAEEMSWKDIMDAMPQFGLQELRYAYAKALKGKTGAAKEAEVAVEQ